VDLGGESQEVVALGREQLAWRAGRPVGGEHDLHSGAPLLELVEIGQPGQQVPVGDVGRYLAFFFLH
jgi:hypothetical protein